MNLHFAGQNIILLFSESLFCNPCIKSSCTYIHLSGLWQWVPREPSSSITDATYSCDSQSIFISFEDGSLSVLTAATLRLRCKINPSAYLPSNPRSALLSLAMQRQSKKFICSIFLSDLWNYLISMRVYPLVVAGHPSEPNQFAVGLTDGGVHVLEPLESEGRWGIPPPLENGAGPSVTSAPASSDQQPR